MNENEYITYLLQNLNPALFQNIILGILAIFIPFAIVFLTDIINQKEPRSYFEKLVLSHEVLSVRAVFWSSIIALFILSFFESGHNDLSNYWKIISIIVLVAAFSILYIPFRKILKYTESGKESFEISFLKKQKINDDLIKIWKSYFSKKYENEYHITEFIKHIDKAIQKQKLDIAHHLANLYIDTCEKRGIFEMRRDVFPKLLKLNEKLNEELENSTYEEYIEPLDLSKIVEILAKDDLAIYDVKQNIDTHISYCIKKYDKLDKDKRKKYRFYIQQTLNKCLIPIFNNIDGYHNEFSVDESWEITLENKDNKISSFVLNTFIKWAENFRGKIIDTELSNHERRFSAVVNTLFPTIDIIAFSYFLKLCLNIYGYDENGIPIITEAAEDENYSIHFGRVDFWYGDDDDKRRKEIEEKAKNEESALIDIIFHYFYNWGILQINGLDITEDKKKNWDDLTLQDIQNIKVKKMQTLKQAFEKYAKDKSEPDGVRPFIRLIDLLIERLEKPINDK